MRLFSLLFCAIAVSAYEYERQSHNSPELEEAPLGFYNYQKYDISQLSKMRGVASNAIQVQNDDMTMGTLFVYAYLSNHLDDSVTERLYLTITNPSADKAAKVVIYSYFPGFTNKTVTVNPSTSIPVQLLPAEIQVDYDNGLNHQYRKESKSIWVQSDQKIKLVATNQASDGGSEDKFAVIPVCQLGNNYISITDESPRKNFSVTNIIAIVAIADNTNVSLDYIDGSVSLNKGQVLVIGSPYESSAISIKSDNNVAVISGTICGFGFVNPVHCSHQSLMIMPTNDWDFQFPYFKMNYEDTGEVMVFFEKNNSYLFVDEFQYPFVFSAGYYLILPVKTGVFLRSNHQIYAVAVGTTNTQDQGAPFLASLAGPSHFATDPVVFATAMNTAEGLNMVHFARLITDASTIGNVALDGYFPNALLYTRMGRSRYYFIDLPIKPGQHVVSGKSNAYYATLVYGYGLFNSYAFNPGMSLEATGSC